ncbi:MAG: choice-of-anchor D domain-containing protein, partial [Deltaproteobacteria bacterium]|nr:choice-of-anchor D domain-containing protein [Deltaproteobacteria bacterium]
MIIGRILLKKLGLTASYVFVALAAASCIQPSGSGNNSGGGHSSQSSAPAVAAVQIQGLLSDGPQYNFGSVLVGNPPQFATHTFTLTNISSTPISSIFASIVGSATYSFVGGIYPGTGGNCNFSLILAPNASCSLVLQFHPTGTTAFTGQLQIAYAGSGSAQNQSRQLLGSGGNTATLVTVPASPYTFPSSPAIAGGPSGAQIFSIGNSGSVLATITNISLTGAAFFLNPAGTTCLVSGTVGSSPCTIEVDYNPANPVPATSNGTLSVSYNDGLVAHDGVGADPAPLTVAISGSSVSPADHLVFLPLVPAAQPVNPPASIPLNTNFSATVQAVDAAGVFTSYFSGTIKIVDENQSADFGAINASHNILANNTGIAMT